jgi:hypothetical protein
MVLKDSGSTCGIASRFACVRTHCPVSTTARLTQHTAVVTCALLKRTPSAARPINRRRLHDGMPGAAQRVVALVISEEEEDVGPLGGQ